MLKEKQTWLNPVRERTSGFSANLIVSCFFVFAGSLFLKFKPICYKLNQVLWMIDFMGRDLLYHFGVQHPVPTNNILSH